MKRAAVWLLLIATTAQAAPNDYAFGWPLQTAGDAGIWQLELTPPMLAASHDPQLADIEVFNAASEPVAVAWLPVDLAAIALSDTVALPIFNVPASSSASTGDSVQLQLQRDADGRLRSLSTTIAPAATTATGNDFIVDASAALANGARLQRLHLDWPSSGHDLRLRIAVDASSDLEHWQSRVSAASVLQLRRDGAELVRRSIAFDIPVDLPYLRLRLLDGSAPSGLTISADRIAASSQPHATRRWIDAEGQALAAPPGRSLHDYSLPSALAVQQLDISVVDDNSIATLQISSRSGSDGEWRPRAQITAFRLRDGASALINDPLQLASEERASEWRIEARPALAKAPTLRLGYRPDRLAFLAQGAAPYQLAIGSLEARRSEAPVGIALAELRSRNGADWQPPLAIAGERIALAGDAAYAAPPPPLPWKQWLLWAVLVIGAAVIGGFALSLLREPRKVS